MPNIDFSEIFSNLIPAFVALVVIIAIPVFNRITKTQNDTDYELLTELYGPLHHYFTHEYTQDSNLERLAEILYQNYYHLSDEALQDYSKILEGNRAALKKLMDDTITHFASLRNKLYFYENFRWLSIFGKAIVFVGIVAIGGMVYLLATDKANHLTNSWSMTYGLIALAVLYILINIIIYIVNRSKISKMVVRSQSSSRQKNQQQNEQYEQHEVPQEPQQDAMVYSREEVPQEPQLDYSQETRPDPLFDSYSETPQDLYQDDPLGAQQEVQKEVPQEVPQEPKQSPYRGSSHEFMQGQYGKSQKDPTNK